MRISESKLNAIIRESLNDVLYEIHALKAVKNINADTRKRIDNGENQYAAHYTHNGQSFDMNKFYADKQLKGNRMLIQTAKQIVNRFHGQELKFKSSDSFENVVSVDFELCMISELDETHAEIMGPIVYNQIEQWMGKISIFFNDDGSYSCSYQYRGKGKSIKLISSPLTLNVLNDLVSELKENI